MEATKSAVLPVTLEVKSWIIDSFLFPLTDWLSGFHWVTPQCVCGIHSFKAFLCSQETTEQ